MNDHRPAYHCEGCGEWLSEGAVIHAIASTFAWHEVEIRYHGEFDHYKQCGPIHDVRDETPNEKGTEV
jgi:hypothetical protein